MGGSQKGSYTYQWPRPALTVDAIIVTIESPAKVLLIKRKNDPYQGHWALPGGFVDEMEDLEHAARRELQEETSVDPSRIATMIQVGTYGEPGRDPRGWTVGIGYASLVFPEDINDIKAADDASDAQWFDIDCIPSPLAFDHKVILRNAFEKLAQEKAALENPGLRDLLLGAAEKQKGDWRR